MHSKEHLIEFIQSKIDELQAHITRVQEATDASNEKIHDLSEEVKKYQSIYNILKNA